MPTPTMVWTPSGATNFEPRAMLFGHIPDPRFIAKEVDRVLSTMPAPIFYTAAQSIKDSGAGKIILLTKFLEAQLSGRFPIHTQTIGDCVSHGYGLGVDILSATQIQAGAAESFPGETATEIIYAGSRVEIGKGKCGAEDGSVGAWAAEFVTTYGTLLRDKYSKLDLTTYDGQTAKKLGAPKAGVPDPLEPLTREHPIKTTSLVRSYPEARDAIANGYPVPVCSTIGFESPSQSRIQRDKDGFGKRRVVAALHASLRRG